MELQGKNCVCDQYWNALLLVFDSFRNILPSLAKNHFMHQTHNYYFSEYLLRKTVICTWQVVCKGRQTLACHPLILAELFLTTIMRKLVVKKTVSEPVTRDLNSTLWILYQLNCSLCHSWLALGSSQHTIKILYQKFT